jgi:hypothetical protein
VKRAGKTKLSYRGWYPTKAEATKKAGSEKKAGYKGVRVLKSSTEAFGKRHSGYSVWCKKTW